MPATDDDTLLPFALPSIGQKKITAAFDGGLISSDGGVLLLAGADKRLGLIDTLAAIIPDHRDPDLITHSMADILRARVFAIACGYPDADDLDDLRRDPAFKLACGRLPESGDHLASQPTMSRWENAPDLRTLIRLTRAMVDLWCKSYRRAPKSITLDIDDTADTVHGHQQLSLFNAHYGERCFLPIHIYDADTGHCVLTILRPGKTPDGKEVRTHLRRLVRRIRLHWPHTRITIRGDGHYGRREAMDWCEKHGVHYIFGLSANAVLAAQVFARPTMCVCGAPSPTWMWCATTPRPDTAPSPGRSSVASWRGSRQRGKVSTSATSSPTSPTVPPNGSMTASTAHVGRRRT